jgi:hypothetical protein
VPLFSSGAESRRGISGLSVGSLVVLSRSAMDAFAVPLGLSLGNHPRIDASELTPARPEHAGQRVDFVTEIAEQMVT